jgi:four helix bundle protein
LYGIRVQSKIPPATNYSAFAILSAGTCYWKTAKIPRAQKSTQRRFPGGSISLSNGCNRKWDSIKGFVKYHLSIFNCHFFDQIEIEAVYIGRGDAAMTQADADAFQERLVLFAVRIIGLVACLPKTTAGRHVGGQLLRSGTSPAPNYAEARGAESRADFVHKLRIGVKELNETGIWLLIILKARMAPDALVASLIKENR